MTLAQVERLALKLPKRQRARLAETLFDSLGGPNLDHAPDEVERRDRELGTGEVEEITREELLKRVIADRRRNLRIR